MREACVCLLTMTAFTGEYDPSQESILGIQALSEGLKEFAA